MADEYNNTENNSYPYGSNEDYSNTEPAEQKAEEPVSPVENNGTADDTSTYHFGREVNDFSRQPSGYESTQSPAEDNASSYQNASSNTGNTQYSSYQNTNGNTDNTQYSSYQNTNSNPGSTQYSSYSSQSSYGSTQGNSNGYNPYPYSNTYTDVPKKKKKEKKTGEKKNHRTLKVAALILVCSLLSGTVGAAIMGLAGNGSLSGSNKTTITTSQHESTAITVKSVDSDTVMSAAEVYAANVNATVGITTSITTNYFGWTTSSAAAGSGFIISEDGYIVTNYHVIEDNDSITVTTYDNTKYDATLVGCDKTNDIAVLKIDATGLSYVKIGNSDNMNVGDDVVAIGNPLGELTFSLTKGAISALNRNVTIETGYTMALIQTDCAINSGNSGGALFNMYGEVIGITNAKYSSSSSSSSASIDNIGFAIPINSVYDIITGIIETGTVTRNTIGVTLTDLGSINRFYANYSGAVITAVESGSSAESAGLQVGDIITELNGEEISDADSLDSAIRSAEAGTTLTLTVYRSSEKMSVDVTVVSSQISATADSESETENTQSQYGYGSYQFY